MTEKSLQDPTAILEEWKDKLLRLDLDLKEKSDLIYERKLSLTDPVIVRINHIRQTFRFYIMAALEEALKTPSEEQADFLKYLHPLLSDDHLNRFLEHFYPIHIEAPDQWTFRDRDDYEQDVFILYDLFKAKKTIEAAEALTQEIKQEATAFPSRFTRKEQLSILKGFHGALLMTFKQSLKNEHQQTLFREISPEYLSTEQIEKRRKEALLFSRPESPQGHPYRRIFLHILFRQYIKTKIKNKETRISYSLVQFERLKQEYLSHWVQQLEQHPEKMKVYQQLYFQGKSFAGWIMEDPGTEQPLLDSLSSEAFNEAMDDIQETVEPEKRAKVEPLSERSSVFKQVDNNFQGFLDKFRPRLSLVSQKGGRSEVLSKLTSLSSGLPNSLPTFDARSVGEHQLSDLMEQWHPLYQAGKPSEEKQQNILILIPNALFEDYHDPLKERLQSLNLSAQIISPEKLRLPDLHKAGLILTFRSLLPNDPEKLTAEIIDVELPLAQYPMSLHSDEAASEKQNQRFFALKKDIEHNEQTPNLTKKYAQEWKIWLLQQERYQHLSKRAKLRQGIETSLPVYQTLLLWLIVQALEEAGHMQKLVQALLRVSECLIIDNFGDLTIQYLASKGFDPKLLTAWEFPQLQQELLQFQEQAPASSTFVEFLEQSLFDPYEVVFLADWAQCAEDQLPIYLRVRQAKQSASSAVKVHKINLFQVFDEKFPFLDDCFQQLQSVLGSAVQLSRSPLPLKRLCQKKAEEYQLEQMLDALAQQRNLLEQQLSSQGEATEFKQYLQNHLLNRIEYFVLGHCLKR